MVVFWLGVLGVFGVLLVKLAVQSTIILLPSEYAPLAHFRVVACTPATDLCLGGRLRQGHTRLAFSGSGTYQRITFCTALP